MTGCEFFGGESCNHRSIVQAVLVLWKSQFEITLISEGRKLRPQACISDHPAADEHGSGRVPIERALERELTGVLRVAHPDPVPIRRFYEAIASLVDRRCQFVRLPAGPLLMALRSAERLGVALPISSENVLGLKHLRAVDLGPDLRRLDLEPRSFADALALLPDG